MAWGYHLILDCYECDLEAMKNRDTVYKFAKELVERIDMVAFGEPQIIHFGEGDKEGFTLVQLIETSNICAHYANDTKTIYLDVFSCKPYDTETVIATVKGYFFPKKITERYVERQ